MGYNLFLDDIRSLHQAANYMHPDIAVRYRTELWDIVRNFEEFVSTIAHKGIPDVVSFDHDLAPEHYAAFDRAIYDELEKTGYHCLKWMCEYIQENNSKPPEIIIHSMNAVGSENIQKYYNNFLKHYKWETLNESDTPTDK